MAKKKTSFALSEEGIKLIEELSRALGISQAGVVEQAVRKLARAEGVTLPGPEKDRKEQTEQRP